ncbi:dolichyl pyrophosphate Man9GlcNAc2 alpha-1,3-glucosyltransferase-like [Actinia tenebrosa]|uniref:Alpha-1,3-glucosyltransferase n=1 Tax=Actinia tenebrosa TaxID=6105 RepID=A0A6P8HDZ3_ACTTE|nr:dolichyl pyrophosphate Man9GlcNAc2 alpha-1,3-glucosyltransferase-like [Actinia tenebrosa]
MAETFYSVLLCVLGAVVLRWSVSLGPYSGKGKPPMFGDYEAQRHWQEITYNLPINQWYYNTSDNNLLYWGLDYPPLTAYHSWLCGWLAHKIDPSWIRLNDSHGYESREHKLFMRYTALGADILVYFPAVLLFCLLCIPGKSRPHKVLIAAVMLLYPGLTLIDHGHFQYNAVSLGFCLWGVIGLCMEYDMLGSVAFMLALSYKQMELYHSMPFFFYLLGKTFTINSWFGRLFYLSKLGVAVIGTFVICWFPFLSNPEDLFQVVHRLFPFGRGLFEDKVANVWCAVSVVIKVKNILTQQQIIKLSLWSTLISVLPSSLNLFRHPSVDRFVISLVNSSLAFFLFSYQVHEKSILLAALPVCVLLPFKPLPCTWFLLISTFSMWPLLEKDGLVFSYVPAMLLFYLAAYHVLNLGKSRSRTKGMFYLSVLGALGLHLAAATVKPPARYPDLYPVLISVYSCAHFILFFMYFNYLQFSLPYFPNMLMKSKQA